jgi:phenylacetate-CoA ligase
MPTDSASYDLSVIVPCFNEELNIPELTERVLRTFETGALRGELILVDDGSSDGTARVIREHARAHPDQVVGVFHPVNRGLAAAWRSGVDAARAPTVSVIDADLQYRPEDLLRLYRTLMDSSADVVQGWRSAVGRERGRRYWLSRGFNTMLNTAFGMHLRDNKSGFVCCAKEVMQDLLIYSGKYYYWQSFIMVAAHAKGYSIREIETLFENRKQGTSFLEHTAYRASARSLVDLTKAVWEYRVHRDPHDISRNFLRKHGAAIADPPSRAARPAHFRAYMSSFERTHWMISRDVERYYETLNATQWLSPSQIRELQDEKLRRLVRHAYRSVAYYRTKMQELKLRPEDIRGQQDLHKLPFLTKDEVRRHMHFDMLQEGVSHDDILRIQTCGSSGEPFVCYADRAQLEFRWAATLRSQEWTGYRFGDPTVRLWNQGIGLTPDQASREQRDAWFANRKLVPVFGMREAELDSVIRSIERYRPVLIEGYAEALDFLARYAETRGGLQFRPRAVISSSQTLPKKSREVIERAFGCKVFDKYSSREFSGIACESDAHAGHLVAGEGYIVELLIDGVPAKPGEVGEVVITDLNNYCMPFIRYRIGDLAQALPDEPSTCGRGLPRIGDVHGRMQSIIQGEGGHFVPGTFFAHVLKDYEYAIKRFQVVQEESGAIRLRLVKASRYADDTLDEIKALIRRHLGDGLRIDVEFLESAELLPASDRLVSVSRLAIDFQQGAPKLTN